MADAVLAVGAVVAAIGVADSLNPSTVAPALALALQEDGTRRTLAFTAGVAGVSLLAGAILVAGPGTAIVDAIPHPSRHLKAIAELVAGAFLLVLAAVAWRGRRSLARRLAEGGERRARGAAAALALGAGIMAVELPTAFPYFGALAAILGTGASLAERLALVLVFNVAFVLPLLAIVAVRTAAGDRAEARIARLRGDLARRAGAALALLLGAGGLALVAVGMRGLT